MSEKEKNEILNAHEMSKEEMAAVAGGGPRIDWNAKCSSTVKDDDLCWGNDACYGASNKYYRNKAKDGCSATVDDQVGFTCSSNDFCNIFSIRYDECAGDFRTPDEGDDDF